MDRLTHSAQIERLEVVEAGRRRRRSERSRLSRSASVAKPIDYTLRRRDRFAHFTGDGIEVLREIISDQVVRAG